MEETLTYISKNQNRYINELKQFLSIPSISNDPKNQADMRDCANFLRDQLNDIGFQQTKIYDLPYQYNGHAIKSLPDLIKHVYANYVEPKKTRTHYLALYSTRYNYEMTFVATPEGAAKKDFASLRKP